jgi:hypothetical protein
LLEWFSKGFSFSPWSLSVAEAPGSLSQKEKPEAPWLLSVAEAQKKPSTSKSERLLANILPQKNILSWSDAKNYFPIF